MCVLEDHMQKVRSCYLQALIRCCTVCGCPCADREAFEPLTPWCLLDAGKVRLFGRRVSPEALYAMAELFLTNGDMCAWLYTGSQVSKP